jgi:hypothetical protein
VRQRLNDIDDNFQSAGITITRGFVSQSITIGVALTKVGGLSRPSSQSTSAKAAIMRGFTPGRSVPHEGAVQQPKETRYALAVPITRKRKGARVLDENDQAL